MSTIKVDTILKRTGTGTINVGQSGDTIAMPSATLTTALPVASGGTGGTSFSAAGLSNTPSFHIRKSSNQTGLSSGGWTKVTFDDEVFDTDSAFASDKFTAPSDGKYFFTSAAKINDGGTNTLVGSGMRFTINGAIAAEEIHFMVNGSNSAEGKSVTAVLNLTASQYVEVYAYAQDNGGAACSITGGNDRDTFFMGYKLIG